jgi:hypothetical protein
LEVVFLKTKSLFGFINRALSSDVRKQKEDYLTQILAWILKQSPNFARQFCTFIVSKKQKSTIDLMEKRPKDFLEIFDQAESYNLEIHTQKSVSSGSGFIDMVIIKDEDGLIFEHKINSELSEQQIQRYYKSKKELGSGTFYTVLITRWKRQHEYDALHKLPVADVNLTWMEIAKFVDDQINCITQVNSFSEKFLLEQLAKYLSEERLGMELPIQKENVLNFTGTIEILSKIDGMLDLIHKNSWKKDCPNLFLLKDGVKPELILYDELKWGRKGISFCKSDWNPNIFAGIILDPTDHRLKPININRGPDVVLLVDLYYGNKEKYYKFLKHNDFQLLIKELQITAGNEKFNFKLDVEVNEWRVIVLRASLLDLVEGKEFLQDQADAVYTWMCEGINLLTANNYLANCRKATFV